MNATKPLYLLIVLALLVSSMPVVAAPEPAEPLALPVRAQEQQTDAQPYLLQLDMPAVDLPARAKPDAVPGYYQAALYRQWTAAEGVLQALQEAGLVQEYTLLPEANAFHVTAYPGAEEQLGRLGALSEQGPMLSLATTTADADRFQAQLHAAIQTTQEQTARQQAPPAPQERQEPAAAPAEQPLESPAAIDEPRYELEDALHGARLAAPAAPMGLLAFTPTTPTVWVQLYNNYVYAQSYTNTTTIFTLTTSGGTQKNYPDNTSFSGWYGSGSNYWANISLYDDGWNNVLIESGDILYVAQQGESPFSITLPTLTAYADPNTNTVTGQAPANISSTDPITPPALRLFVNRSEYVTTTASGLYVADNVGNFDPNDQGYIRYYDANGNWAYRNFRAPIVYVRGGSGGYSSDDSVLVRINPYTEVTITLKRGSQTIATANGTSDDNGDYAINLDDVYGNPAYIQADDVVEVAYGGGIITVDVPTLDASADAVADEVNGIGPADIVTTTAGLTHTLQVNIGGINEYTTTAGDGSFVVTGTLNPGDYGWLRYINPDGNYVYDNFVAPVLYVRGESYGYYADNYVSGYATTSSVRVTLNLKRGTSTVATAYDMADSNGYYEAWFYDVYGNPVNIEAGDSIEAAYQGQTTVVPVPEFDFTSDPGDDMVYGSSDATVVTYTYGLTQTLAVWPTSLYDWDYGKYVTKRITGTLAGLFVAQNPFYDSANPFWWSTDLDWWPGTQGHLRYVDAAGNYVYDDFYAPDEEVKLTIYARGSASGYEAENYVRIYNPGCGNVDVVLENGSGAVKAQTTLWACYEGGDYLYDVYGNPADIEAGDTIEATYQGQTTVVDVPEFDFTSNSDDDMVHGSTDATVVTDTYGLTQTLAIWPESFADWGYGKYVTKRITGTLAGLFVALNPFYYNANLANGDVTLDWGPRTQGHLRYVDADYNYIYARFQAPYEYTRPVVYVRGNNYMYYAENYVYIYNPGCDNVDVVLENSSGAVKAQTTLWACDWGGDYLGADIEAGDTVQVTSGDQTTVVSVPAFDVTSDADNDRVTGVTDAAVVTNTYGLTQTLAVWPDSFYDWDYGKYVLTSSGVFTAENPFYCNADSLCGSTTLDWGPGTQGHLRYVDADDNYVYASFVAPRDEPEIWVHKDSNYVWGYVVTDHETPVTVTLKTSDTLRAVAYASSDLDGWFQVNFYDATGVPIDIKAGDDVVVQASAPVTVPVVPLTGQADVNNDTVSGEGPANDLLNVIVGWGDDQSAPTDGSGAYSADFRGINNITPGESVEVQHRNADGHYVYINFYAGPKLHAQLDSFYAWGYALTANSPVTVTLKDSAGAVKGSGTATSGSSNGFNAYLYDNTGQRAIIAAGDVLEVDLGGDVVSMTVTGMTAQVHAENDTINGSGPASTPLGVAVGNFYQTVMSDSSGNWSADASGIEDIEPGEQVLVRHINASFHETWLIALAPVVYVRASGSEQTSYQADNYVSGYAPDRTIVDITLKRGSATVSSRRFVAYGYYSTYLYDALGQSADIEGDDQLLITTAPTVTINVPTIDATVDADADTVSGVGPANASLGVYVSSGYNQTAHTDASGVFSAAFDYIYPGDYAYIRYQNPAGHWIHARFRAVQAGTPAIYARWNWDDDVVCANCASGQAGVANTVVALTLSRGGSALATSTDMANDWGNYSAAFTDAAGNAVHIEADDVIQAVVASDPISMTVEAFTVQASTASDTLYGAGPVGERLWIIAGNCGGNTTVKPDGTWFFACDLGKGNNGYIYHINDSGHYTYLSWAVPYVAVRENGNAVFGYVERGIPVTVQLLNSRGGERGQATTTSSAWNGWFGVDLLDGNGDPLIIKANDSVVVQASPATTVPVAPIAVTVNLTSDQVNGVGPANAELGVSAGGCWRKVTSDAGGNFTADASGECDLQAGDWIQVNYWNDDDNLVYIAFNTPLLRVNLANDIVDGYSTPNATASLMLQRSGAITATATATASTNQNGFFSAYFTDASGVLVDIQAGDTVNVTASPTTSAPVVALGVSVNVSSDTVTGNGPADALLLLKVFAEGGGWSLRKSVATSGSGDLNTDLSNTMDLTGASYAYLRYSDASGNQTSIHTTPSSSPRLDQVEQAVEDEGAEVQNSAFGAANHGDLTPPVSFNGGGGKLVFASRGGSLVLTRPDGSVDDNWDTLIIVHNAPDGQWDAQVRVNGDEGEQYAIAIGEAEIEYNLYLPLVMRSTGS